MDSVASVQMPMRRLLDGCEQPQGAPPTIAKNVWIGSQVLVGGDSMIGDGAILDHHVLIENDVEFGRNSLACYRAQIGAGSIIGNDCVIGGFIGERSIIGNNCRVFGSLVHRHPSGWVGWDDDAAMERGPVLGNHVFVAFGAVLVGNIKIGDFAYIGANAVVAVDLDPSQSVGPGEQLARDR